MMSISLLSRLSDNNPLNLDDNVEVGLDPQAMMVSELKMLLTSRVRMPNVGDIPLLEHSILNYGIDESFSPIEKGKARLSVLELRLKKAISAFEPRLTQVELFGTINDYQMMNFRLFAYYLGREVALEFCWDDVSRRFHFNE
ncbi:TPA: hypothetical protein ACS72K_003726 [Providencia alcalifaciens]